LTEDLLLKIWRKPWLFTIYMEIPVISYAQ
jgi:hypothetical protein